MSKVMRLVFTFWMVLSFATSAIAQPLQNQIKSKQSMNEYETFKPSGDLILSFDPVTKTSLINEPITALLKVINSDKVVNLNILLSSKGNIEIGGNNAIMLPATSDENGQTIPITLTVRGVGQGEVVANVEALDSTNVSFANEKAILYFLAVGDTVFYGNTGPLDLQLQSIAWAHDTGKLNDAEYNDAIQKVLGGGAKEESTTNRSLAPSILSAEGTITVQGKVLWTDSNGGTHPVRLAPVEIRDDELIDSDLVATVTTDLSGNYTATVDNNDGLLQGGRDIFIRVLAKYSGFTIKPAGLFADVHRIDSSVHPDLPDGSNLTINITANNSDDNNTAFSVYSAMVPVMQYVMNVRGSRFNDINLIFPNSCPGNAVSCFDGTNLNILRLDRFDWDVIQHEYGHYVQQQLNIANSPGGNHGDENLGERLGKDKGIRLAWGEGWPTYFALSLQQVEHTNELNVPNVGDTRYEDTEDYNINYDIETLDGAPSLGEDNETSVQRILWDLYDSANDAGDTNVALGDSILWNTIDLADPATLYAAYQAITQNLGIQVVARMGCIFSEHHVAPAPTAPADKSYVQRIKIPEFKWDANGSGPSNLNNKFVVEFYDSTFRTLLFSSPEQDGTSFTPTQAQWNDILNRAGPSINWLVRGRQTNNPVTGPYVSCSRQLLRSTIDRGLDYLRQRHTQYANGSWLNSVGITGLATLAFLNQGYGETDPDVQKGIQYIIANVHPDGSIYSDYYSSTYETGISILPLKATHNPNYSDEISAAKDWLVRTQWDEDSVFGSVPPNNWYWGGFGYGRNVRPDLSNSQFALLGLDAADLPKSDPTWGKALRFVSRTQNFTGEGGNDQPWSGNDGGFIYYPGSSLAGGTTSYGSMTGAGIWGYALSGRTPNDPSFSAALKWVENHYTWEYNPTTTGSWGSSALYYYYLSMSKALSMARKTTVGTHDWYKELSAKLTSVQRNDGSWIGSGSLDESLPELVTAYSVLALQTRTLPANADLEMVIILHSPADLHLYDAYGNHVGKNYSTGGIELGIPGSNYSLEDPQTISIHPPVAGNYHLELLGTGQGDWQVEVIGYQDGVQVSYDAYTGTISTNSILASDLNVGAFEGGLTIFSAAPEAAAVLSVQPEKLNLEGQASRLLQTSIDVKEIGGSKSINGISIFATDLVDDKGNIIPGSNWTFDPRGFDLTAGSMQTVSASVSLPSNITDGQYIGSITIESINAGTKSIPVSVDVKSNQPPDISADPLSQSVQYSDPITEVTITATDSAEDNIELSSISWSNGTDTFTGLPNGLSITAKGCTTGQLKKICEWGLSGKVSLAPHIYTIKVTVVDNHNAPADQVIELVVPAEDAVVTYTGPALVSTSSISTSTALVPLRATIQDITAVDPVNDPYPGEITNATVTFVNRDNANAELCVANLILINPDDPKVGTAACDWAANIGSNSGVDFNIGVIVRGYYTRDSIEDNVLIVVSKPGSNFITGGGYIINQTSSGKYAGDPGEKSNFGLNIKFNSKLTNLQGRITLIVRQNGHVYQIRSNALSSLVTVPYNASKPSSGTAELIGKANITDITDPYNPVSLEGGAKLQVVMKDNGEPGNKDTINISVWSKDGKLLYSSKWSGVKTLPQTLDGGNIQVH